MRSSGELRCSKREGSTSAFAWPVEKISTCPCAYGQPGPSLTLQKPRSFITSRAGFSLSCGDSCVMGAAIACSRTGTIPLSRRGPSRPPSLHFSTGSWHVSSMPLSGGVIRQEEEDGAAPFSRQGHRRKRSSRPPSLLAPQREKMREGLLHLAPPWEFSLMLIINHLCICL